MFEVETLTAALLQRRRAMDDVNATSEGKAIAHPAAKGPRIFADTAKLSEIQPLLDAGIINGVTTNPSLLKAAGATSWVEAKEMLSGIMQACAPHPVSLELTKLSEEAMVTQAEELDALGENGVIKVPIGGYAAVDAKEDPFTGLKVLRRLWERDIRTNATLIFNTTQAYWAANAGATYVSPFLGRVGDYLYKNDAPDGDAGNSLYHLEDKIDGAKDARVFNTEYVAAGGPRKDAGVRLIREIAAVFANYDIRTEILAASIRNAAQLTECMLAGADILTVPAGVLATVPNHPLSDAGMIRFDEDAQTFTH